MPTYYINAESVTQNGLTPSTGYHNFTNLIAGIGAMASDWITEVVYTVSPVNETTALRELCGLIRAYDSSLPYPILSSTSQSPNYHGAYSIKSNTTFFQLNLIQNYIEGSGTRSSWNNQSGSTNITYDSCFFKTTTNLSSMLGACRSLTIKNSVFCKLAPGTLVNDCTALGDENSTLVFCNNSAYHSSSYQFYTFFTIQKCKLIAYNNAFDTSSGAYRQGAFVSSNMPATGSSSDYIISKDQYLPIWNATVYAVLSPVPSHSFGNVDPKFVAPDLNNLELQETSPCIDAGVTNAYTPSYDIRGRGRFGAYDVGAYEYIPTCWSFSAKYFNSYKFFRLNGSEDRHPKDVRIPGNVDRKTAVMMEHGKFIDSSQYKIL